MRVARKVEKVVNYGTETGKDRTLKLVSCLPSIKKPEGSVRIIFQKPLVPEDMAADGEPKPTCKVVINKKSVLTEIALQPATAILLRDALSEYLREAGLFEEMSN